MFLFTNNSAQSREPAPSAGARAPAGVMQAIRSGAQSTGAGFDYLLATAQRESALDPAAKAATSSATGLFQFIESTWLGVMKTAGPKLGLSTYADAITAKPDGTYAVADGATRQAILDLRRDPQIAATLAGALTRQNGEALTASLGREPTDGELYAAHVLGARGATQLLGTAQANPSRAAALELPEAAAANRGLFYDRSGRPRSASELAAVFASGPTAAATAARSQPAATDVTAIPAAATSYASMDGGGLRNLFQTDRRQGAISEGVARLWQTQNRGEPAAAAPSYFPRSDSSLDSVSVVPATPAGTAIANAPLPPRRPAEFAVQGLNPAVAAAATQARIQDLSLVSIRSGP